MLLPVLLMRIGSIKSFGTVILRFAQNDNIPSLLLYTIMSTA